MANVRDDGASDDVDATTGFQPDPDMDPRVVELSQKYLRELELGKSPNRAEYLGRFPELYEELEECLDGIELAHSLQTSGVAKDSMHKEPSAAEFATEPLGDFKIIRQIGRGGMGIVYEAVQLSLGRRVALKVLPFAAAMDERQRQRFQLESHAAAQLHHNHRVPVSAVGCDRGTHSSAMQLIEGDTLGTLIERLRERQEQLQNGVSRSGNTIESHGLRSTVHTSTASLADLEVTRTLFGQPRSRFTAAAKLIAQLAEALEYAHSAGIIHRDIKPANILLDSSGRGWITDFGLAQVAANSLMTQTGDLVGTLRYMSPEQAAGRRAIVDHRSDIYSLGATLYELLCLHPIFVGDDRQTLLHAILQTEPQMLRQVDRSIPIELETIVHKAIAKTPSDRFASAEEFAADLKRFIEQRPIKARRPTLVDQARKWARRHPSAVAATLAFLAIGVIGLSIGMAAIASEQSKTRDALEREQARAAEAESRLAIAQAAADDLISIAEFELSDNPFEEQLRRKLLEAALSHYDTFIEEQASNPQVLAQLLDTHAHVQSTLNELVALENLRLSLLLNSADVIEDLALTEPQVAEFDKWIEEISEQNRFMRADRNTLTADALHSAFVKIALQWQEEMKQTLTAQQVERLDQIVRQLRGISVFRESDIVEALALTTEQRGQIRLIESEFRFDRFGPRNFERGRRRYGSRSDRRPTSEPYRNSDSAEPNRVGPTGFDIPLARGPGSASSDQTTAQILGDPAADSPGRGSGREFGSEPGPAGGFAMEGLSEASKSAVQKALEILSSQQLEIWKQLIGEPFEGEIASFRR